LLAKSSDRYAFALSGSCGSGGAVQEGSELLLKAEVACGSDETEEM
jgi:hypothetical protein